MMATNAIMVTIHHSRWLAEAPVPVKAALGVLGPISTSVPSSATNAAGVAGVNTCFAFTLVSLSAASGACIDKKMGDLRCVAVSLCHINAGAQMLLPCMA